MAPVGALGATADLNARRRPRLEIRPGGGSPPEPSPLRAATARRPRTPAPSSTSPAASKGIVASPVKGSASPLPAAASWRVTRTPDVGGARCPPSTCPCGGPPYWATPALPLPEMPEIAMPVPVMVTIRPTTVSPRMATRALSERRALLVRATRVMARDRARSNSAPVGTGRSVSSSRTTSSAPCGGTPPSVQPC